MLIKKSIIPAKFKASDSRVYLLCSQRFFYFMSLLQFVVYSGILLLNQMTENSNICIFFNKWYILIKKWDKNMIDQFPDVSLNSKCPLTCSPLSLQSLELAHHYPYNLERVTRFVMIRYIHPHIWYAKPIFYHLGNVSPCIFLLPFYFKSKNKVQC